MSKIKLKNKQQGVQTTKMVNVNEDIPVIRTLFKTGYHYEYQLVKRSELLFINDGNGMVLDYFDCDF